MTIAQQTPIVKYAYTDPDTFTFNFKILEDEDIAVIHTDGSTGLSTLLSLNTDYTVNFNVNVQGGDVVVSFDGSDGTIEIRRDMPIEQQVDFVNNERLDMEIIERAYDRLTMLIQQYLIDLQEGTGLSNFRGEWATNNQYTAGEVVKHSPSGGSIYLAVNEHTSGVFADDLAAGNWNLFIDVGNLEQLLTDTEAAAAAALVSESNAAQSAVDASRYGLKVFSTKQGDLTATINGTDVDCTTDDLFAELLMVFHRGQQIYNAFDAVDIISGVDGSNSAFTIDNFTAITDLVAVCVKAEPVNVQTIDVDTVLNVRAAPGVGEFASVADALAHLDGFRFLHAQVEINIGVGTFDAGTINITHTDSVNLSLIGAGADQGPAPSDSIVDAHIIIQDNKHLKLLSDFEMTTLTMDKFCTVEVSDIKLINITLSRECSLTGPFTYTGGVTVTEKSKLFTFTAKHIGFGTSPLVVCSWDGEIYMDFIGAAPTAGIGVNVSRGGVVKVANLVTTNITTPFNVPVDSFGSDGSAIFTG